MTEKTKVHFGNAGIKIETMGNSIGQMVGLLQQIIRKNIGNLVFETQNYIIYLGRQVRRLKKIKVNITHGRE